MNNWDAVIFLDLLYPFFNCGTQSNLDDQCSESHSEWLGCRSNVLLDLLHIVIFSGRRGDKFWQLDPASIAKEFAAKLQEAFLERARATRLNSITCGTPCRLLSKMSCYKNSTGVRRTMAVKKRSAWPAFSGGTVM